MTKRIGVKYVAYCCQIACDRCGHIATDTDDGFDNFLTLDFDAGLSSPLGDGSHIDLDLCHDCIQQVLGRWLRISKAEWANGPKRIDLVRARLASDEGVWADILISDHSIAENDANAALAEQLEADHMSRLCGL